MSEEDGNKKVPEPFNVIFSPALFHKIKNNQAAKIEDEDVPEEELEEFEKFKTLFKDFLNRLNKQDHTSLSALSNLMSMWGYTRKYCGMCGRPIIGKPNHIQNRLVCKTCYDSYKITEELFNREDEDYKTDKRKQNKKLNEEKNKEETQQNEEKSEKEE